MSQLHYNTKFENFSKIPVKGLAFLLKKLFIFNLFQTFGSDHRLRKGTYCLSSLLMVALQILLFRLPSKNHFYQSRKLNRSYKNIGTLAHINFDRFPHSKTLDDAFWSLDSTSLEPILFEVFKKLQKSKLFSNHPSLKKTALTTWQLMLLRPMFTTIQASTLVKDALIALKESEKAALVSIFT